MCESSIWLLYPDGQSEKIADNVMIVTQDGDEVVLRWFLDKPRRVTGSIRQVDANKHRIIIAAPAPLSVSTAAPTASAEPAQANSEHAHDHPHPHPD